MTHKHSDILWGVYRNTQTFRIQSIYLHGAGSGEIRMRNTKFASALAIVKAEANKHRHLLRGSVEGSERWQTVGQQEVVKSISHIAEIGGQAHAV